MSHPNSGPVGADSTTPACAERRAAPRHASAYLTVCRAVFAGRGDSWTALVENVSTTGVALQMIRPFAPGTVLAIPTPPGAEELPLARVVRSVEDGKGHWHVGCQFVRELTEGQLLALR